ncbi:pyruvate dehydrogenase E2 component (dihydrolipoamide acetyltransferase) [Sphingopyxis panaciterrae]|uniref:2-oxo acid dehydrogenase subunit E2 n=1 Tax=Sphingopyxis panaciterrae TaxID=363841 RepID=UPI00142286FC|nr:2-oxo acid dehydrogenase subunit E2 [Sphingopyxis panaciterrae]NIJ37629.1 pyruvate dehydrogenase E2 component (dihydrolipoamide acetyltransferase) [Sphingopyxis panaciterrae]
MAIELRMPALSPTMEEGTLAKWLVKPGDVVKAGDLVAEIETDKATMELEAVGGGRIEKLLVPEGSEDIAVGTVIALLVEDQAVPAPATANAASTAGDEKLAEPLFSAASRQTGASTHHRPPAPTLGEPAGRLNATPLARRIAAAKNIDLAAINGSGPRGMVMKADLGLLPIIPQSAGIPTPSASTAPPRGTRDEAPGRNPPQTSSAPRRIESMGHVPHLYLTARCNIDPLLALQADLNAELCTRGIELSVDDMLMKALALTLRAVPQAHVEYGGDILRRLDSVDISMSLQSDHGLVAPVIRGVDTCSLSALALAARAAAAKVREGRLAPEDYEGGSASLFSLGMFKIDEAFPAITPPQALSLGTGAAIRQPWNVDGELALATVMAATAVFDRRAIDGATAAEFMAAFRQHIENPLILLS